MLLISLQEKHMINGVAKKSEEMLLHLFHNFDGYHRFSTQLVIYANIL
jgi:hypothetical protein